MNKHDDNPEESLDILIVEDDVGTASALGRLLAKDGYKNAFSVTVDDALAKAAEFRPRLVLLDLTLPDGDGLEAMAQLKENGVQEVIIVSGTSSADHTRQCLRAGAFDFITKPAAGSELVAAVRRADAQMKLENLAVGSYPFVLNAGFGALQVNASEAGKALFRNVASVAEELSAKGCLLTGPAGSLKNDIAASIHFHRATPGEAYLIHCASESDEYALQRFTGNPHSTNKDSQLPHAYLNRSVNDTLVLDDLSALRMDIQRLLAEILKNRTKPSTDSGDAGLACECAFIGVLREEAAVAIKRGRLDADLYELLASRNVNVPSLLERSEDIPYLAKKAVEQLNTVFDTEKSISQKFMNELQRYSWPGNLMELRNLMLTAYRLTEPGEEIREGGPGKNQKSVPINVDIAPFIGTSLRDVERVLIDATLQSCDENRREAARILGVSTKTLYNRLRSYKESESTKNISG